jgi:hypothetical protein
MLPPRYYERPFRHESHSQYIHPCGHALSHQDIALSRYLEKQATHRAMTTGTFKFRPWRSFWTFASRVSRAVLQRPHEFRPKGEAVLGSERMSTKGHQ